MNAASEASLKSRTKFNMYKKNRASLVERINKLKNNYLQCINTSTKYSKVLEGIFNV